MYAPLPEGVGRMAQVAGGSFDLSTGCPAGYVSFLSTFCLFSPKEFRQRSIRRRGREGEGVGRGPVVSQLPLFILLPPREWGN